MNNELKKKEEVIKILKEYLSSGAFTAEQVIDTPTDALAIVPRKYVTRNSTTDLRPTTSVLGEFYFDTTAGLPAWWNGTNFQDAAGNVI